MNFEEMTIYSLISSLIKKIWEKNMMEIKAGIYLLETIRRIYIYIKSDYLKQRLTHSKSNNKS